MMENYLRLLIAIEYSTNENKNNIYGVYDSKCKEVALFYSNDIRDIAKFFNTTCKTIASDKSRGSLIRNRYKVEKFEQEKETIEDLLNLKEDLLE